jgi:hypothetical protein
MNYLNRFAEKFPPSIDVSATIASTSVHISGLSMTGGGR